MNPAERVTDFRTFVSGVKAKHLKGALSLRQCQKEVAAILKNKFLVGHALSNDLKVYLAFMLFRGLCVVDERGLVGSNKLNIYIFMYVVAFVVIMLNSCDLRCYEGRYHGEIDARLCG